VVKTVHSRHLVGVVQCVMRRVAVLVLLLWLMVVTLVLAVSTPVEDDITVGVNQIDVTTPAIAAAIRTTPENVESVKVYKAKTGKDDRVVKEQVNKDKAKNNQNSTEKENDLDDNDIDKNNTSNEDNYDYDDDHDDNDEYENDYYYWEDSLNKDGINKYMDGGDLLTSKFFDGWDDYDGSGGDDYTEEEGKDKTGRIVRLPWEKK